MDVSAKFLPQLPGYRPKTQSDALSRPQIFQRMKGHSFVKDENTGSVGELNMEESSVLSIGNISRPGTAESTKDNTGMVLTFQAYYDDEANGAGPTFRQAVFLYFFVDDRSIKIVVAPKKRGGDRSGTKLRRSIVLKEDGEPFCASDFQLGNSITIYGRAYFVVDCDQKTRNYLSDGLVASPERQQEELNYSEFLQPESDGQCDPEWSAFRPKKNELKIYMEAKMGNTTNNGKREGFIAYGNTVLKFLCYWDDSRNLYGKRHEYVITYHLADDTADITAVSRNTDGGECKQLLKRSKLPKTSGCDKVDGEFFSNPGKGGFYHWSDLSIGSTIDVYTRPFVIIDTDESTRSFFLDNGIDLGPAIRFDPPPEKEYVREIPPHFGFGSDEDSLRSCTGSVAPSVPRQKKFNPDAAVLVFLASIISDDPCDKLRKFVVTFYVDDNTIKILEPPQRNSGFVGGMFLSRQKMKTPDGSYFTPDFFDVGNVINVSSHKFLLTGADSGTQEYLSKRKGK